jgi:hypothetical protein
VARFVAYVARKEMLAMIIDQKDGRLIIWGEAPYC